MYEVAFKLNLLENEDSPKYHYEYLRDFLSYRNRMDKSLLQIHIRNNTIKINSVFNVESNMEKNIVMYPISLKLN